MTTPTIPAILTETGVQRISYTLDMHDHFSANFVQYAWTLFLLVWAMSALRVKRSIKRQSIASRLQQSLPVITAFCLVFSPNLWPHWLRLRFFPQSDTALVWIGVALTALGMGFAILARLWIGKNWSGTITIKDPARINSRRPLPHRPTPHLYGDALGVSWHSHRVRGNSRAYRLPVARAGVRPEVAHGRSIHDPAVWQRLR